MHSRATHPDIVEPVVYEDDIRTFRISTNTLGAGYIEAVANTTLLRLREQQPTALRGSVAPAPVLEAEGRPRIGRFAWKNQHASLVSFAADAYLNEMGITSPLFPTENTSSGRDVGTGGGIPVQPAPEFASTAPQIRTAPLWALRTRNRLMHDGLTFTEREAIERHAGQAAPVRARFQALSAADQALLLKFLDLL